MIEFKQPEIPSLHEAFGKERLTNLLRGAEEGIAHWKSDKRDESKELIEANILFFEKYRDRILVNLNKKTS